LKQLNKNIILANLPKKRVNLAIYNEIDSTNEISKNAAIENEFNLILTEKQTAGKGRHGKNWYSPKNGNIYMSLSTKKELNYAPLSLLVGIICAQVLIKYTNKEAVRLKWPNDIVVNSKKIGGILVEKVVSDIETTTIVGIGINFLIDSQEKWWGDLSNYNVSDSRDQIISMITSKIINIFDKENEDWIDEWLKYCMHINKEVKIIKTDGSSENAIFKSIDQDGCALLETEMGIKIFNSGEISIKGVY
jgi:BirA family biotin operon repressor/biotin-[acetyl-CoA-carboxylase] ligase